MIPEENKKIRPFGPIFLMLAVLSVVPFSHRLVMNINFLVYLVANLVPQNNSSNIGAALLLAEIDRMAEFISWIRISSIRLLGIESRDVIDS